MKLHRTFVLIIVLALLGTACPFLPHALAQSPASTPSPIPPGASRQELAVTLAQLGYDDTTLAGPYGQTTFYFGLPTHWEVLPGSSLALLLSYATNGISALPAPTLASSSVLTASPVELRVALDGTSVYQTVFNTVGGYNLTIPLPDVWPARAPTARHRLEIFVRMAGRCENTILSSVTIHKGSSLIIPYRLAPLPLDLAAYPSPFYQRTFLPSTAYIVLPGQPSREQVAAGLSLAAGLGKLTGNNLVITATSDLDWDQANPLHEHLLILGTPDSNRLIRQLNDAAELPAPLRLRRMRLTTSGPDAAAPADNLTYVLQVTNTEPVSSTGLHLRSWLPSPVEHVTCQPNCQVDDGQAGWEIGPLPSGATAAYTLSFVLPNTSTLPAIELTSELVQNREVVNVSTLHSQVELNATPTLIHADQIGDVFFAWEGRAVPETDGVIELLPSPWQADKALLLVTGLTDAGVLKAGQALGAVSHFPGMQGQVALVQETIQRPDASPQQAQDFTLADLGYTDQVVTGIGREDVYYRLDLPLAWNLTREAGVHFLFSHSRLLDPTRSSLTLTFNGTPIASVALDESNALSGELDAQLPSRSARPGRPNTLLARAEMSLPDPCAPADSSQAWVTLNASSSLHLAHSVNDKTSLGMEFWPLPFVAHPHLEDVMVVLPDRPSAIEYDAAVWIAAQLGAASGNDRNAFQPAAWLGEPAGADLSAYHLIVIGRPTRNPLLAAVNEVLAQPFNSGTDTIRQQVDDIIFRLPAGLDLGYLQLVPSPWNAERALLAVTGTSDAGVDWAARALADPDRVERLEGNLALLRGVEVFTTDTRKLTAGGKVAAIQTAVPQAAVVGTATPTPAPISTPTASIAASSEESFQPRTPAWLLAVVAGGVAVILIILGAAVWQARRSHPE